MMLSFRLSIGLILLVHLFTSVWSNQVESGTTTPKTLENDMMGPDNKLKSYIEEIPFSDDKEPEPNKDRIPRSDLSHSHAPYDDEDSDNTLNLEAGSGGGEVTCEQILSQIGLLEHQHCFRGQNGERGETGGPGPLGPRGLKGDKGDSIAGLDGPSGPKGDRGENGTPGISLPGIPGAKGDKGDSSGSGQGYNGQPGVPSAAVYSNVEELRKNEGYFKVGSIAYVRASKKFYGRLHQGWAPFIMGEPISSNSVKTNKIYPWQNYEPYVPKYRRPSPSPENSEFKFNLVKTKPERVSKLRLVALNDPWTGNMNGVDFINYQCQKEAYAARVTGIYRAFLSSKKIDLPNLVKLSNYTILNLKNETIYASWGDLFKRNSTNITLTSTLNGDSGSLYSFNGKNVVMDEHWDENLIWHGTFASGKGSLSQSCKSWTTNSSEAKGLASDFLYEAYMLDQRKETCDSPLIVLCVEIPTHFAEHYMTSVFNLPVGTNKSIALSFDEHKQVLVIYDEESHRYRTYRSNYDWLRGFRLNNEYLT